MLNMKILFNNFQKVSDSIFPQWVEMRGGTQGLWKVLLTVHLDHYQEQTSVQFLAHHNQKFHHTAQNSDLWNILGPKKHIVYPMSQNLSMKRTLIRLEY